VTLTIDHTAVPTSVFPAITLTELDAQAARQTRVDRKYLIRIADVSRVLAALPSGTRTLEIDGGRSFAYESTYFDTPDLRCYHDAARRRRHRFKVRTRLYTDSGLCRLEVKTRDGRRRTVKSRLDYEASDRDLLTPDGRRLVADATGTSHWADVLRPSSVTRYRRTTLVLPHEQTRVTVDVGLAVSLPGRSAVPIDRVVIVETKGGHGPTGADRALWTLGHRPARVSKYGTGLALLRPDLPSNKWHRTLTHMREEMT
jgi:hypothetical protein